MTNNVSDATNMTAVSDTNLLNTTLLDGSWLTTGFSKILSTAVSTTTKSSVVEITTTGLPHNASSTTLYMVTSSHGSTIAPEENSPVALFFLTCVFFLVAVALVVKVIVSNRKTRTDLIGGSARWRLAASQQSGAGPVRTAASYVPMNNRERPTVGGLDSVGPGENVDWERQFFDDTEPTLPSRLQLHYRE